MPTLTQGSLSINLRSADRFLNGVYSNTYSDIHDGFFYRNTVGEDTPNFHARKAAGELLPHTNFSQFVSEGHTSSNINYWSDGLQSWDTRPAYGPRDAFGGDWVRDPADGPVHEVPDYGNFVQEAAAKIVSGKHDTLTFVAEVVKLKRMFVNMLERLAKGKLPPLSDAPGLWLEARYGWRPLLYDLVSMQEAAVAAREPIRTRYSQRSGDTYVATSETYEETYESAAEIYWKRVSVYTSQSVRGSVTADVIWDTTFQLDPVATAWELLPWSFVLDWIFNVGRMIQAIEFQALASEATASGGYSVREIRETTSGITFKPGHGRSGDYTVTGTQVTTYTMREPTTVPILPQLEMNIDALKSIDLAALMYNLLK